MNAVFVRTEKGEREIASRSNQLSHDAWLALVMVDGRSSVSELLKLRPRLYDVEQSIELLAGESFIRVVEEPAANEEAAREERTLPPTLDAEWHEAEPEAEEESHERVVKTRLKRKRKISFAWLRKLAKGTLAVSVLLLVLAIAVLFMFPLSIYVPHVEKMLSQKMQQPVSITGMRFVLDPRPALVLRQISVGQHAKIGSARIVPDVTTLHRRVKFISALELESAALDVKELAAFIPLLKRDDAIRLRKIAFSDFKVNAGGVTFTPVSGEARLDDEAIFENATLSVPGLNAEIVSAKSDYSMKIAAKNWQLPTGAALLFDSLNASGTATAAGLSLAQLDAKLHGGTASGNVNLGWDGVWQLDAAFAIKDLNLETLVPVFSKQFSLSGELSGDTRFAAKSSDLATLFTAQRADANFRIVKGILQNVDIVETIKNAKSTRGGRAHFDEFAGSATLLNGAYQFRQCKLTSGVINATGQFDVSASDRLSGRMNAVFSPLPARGTMAIQIGGTISDPVLKPF